MPTLVILGASTGDYLQISLLGYTPETFKPSELYLVRAETHSPRAVSVLIPDLVWNTLNLGSGCDRTLCLLATPRLYTHSSEESPKATCVSCFLAAVSLASFPKKVKVTFSSCPVLGLK